MVCSKSIDGFPIQKIQDRQGLLILSNMLALVFDNSVDFTKGRL